MEDTKILFMDCRKHILIAAILFLPELCLAQPYYGFNLSFALYPKEPPHGRGIQVMFNYDPQLFKWRKFNIYFDVGFSHFWVTNTPYYRIVNIYSIAPVIRHTFSRCGFIHPYLELSIGLAYLNHSHIDNRNLGIHFSFQDRIGLGAFFGPAERFSVGIHAVHYSNAHLCNHNSGISFPIVLDIGYRFC